MAKKQNKKSLMEDMKALKKEDRVQQQQQQPTGIKSFLQDALKRTGNTYSEEKANKLLSKFNHNYDAVIDFAGNKAGIKDKDKFREGVYDRYKITKPSDEFMAEIDFIKKPISADQEAGYDKYQQLQDDLTLAQSMATRLQPKEKPLPIMEEKTVARDVTRMEQPQLTDEFLSPEALQEREDEAHMQTRMFNIGKKVDEINKAIAEQGELNKKKFGFVSKEHEGVRKQFDKYSSILQKAIDEGEEKRLTAQQEATGLQAQAGTAYQRAMPSMPYLKADREKIDNLRGIKDLYGKMGKILSSPHGKDFGSQMSGLLHGFSDNFFTRDFATLGLNEMSRLMSVKDAFEAQKKLEEEGKTQEEIAELMPEEQKALLDTYELFLNIQAGNKGNFGSVIGEGLKEMIPFIAQFAATGGVGTGVKKMVKEFVENKTKSAVAGRLAGAVAKPLAQAAAMIPAELQNYAQRVAPTMDEGGKLIEGAEPLNAAFKAYLTTIAEVAGEDVGVFVNKWANKAARKNFMKLIASNPTKAQEFLGKISLALTRETNFPGIQGFVFEGLGEEATGIMQASIDQDGSFFTPEAQAQLWGMSFMASGTFATLSAPSRIATRRNYNKAQDLLNDIPNEEYSKAIEDVAMNYQEPLEAIEALDAVSKEFKISQEDYYKARNFIGNSVRYNQMNTARAIQVEQQIAQSKGSDGNVTLTRYNGEPYSIRNPQDLGKEGRVIFLKSSDGSKVIPVISSKVTEWESKTPEQITDEQVSGQDAQDETLEQEQQIQEEAAQKGLIEGNTVETPLGKRTLVSINPDGSAIVEDTKGEQATVNSHEIEAYKTQEQKDAEKLKQETDMPLMEGIEEGTEIVSDEPLTEDSDIRVVDFANGQSKIITPEGEQVFNSQEERDIAIQELVSSELEATEENIDEMPPEQAFSLMLKDDPDIAKEIFSEEISDVRKQAEEARAQVKETTSRKQKQDLLLKAKQLEAEAERLDVILQDPTMLEVKEEEEIIKEEPTTNEQLFEVADNLHNEYTQEEENSPYNLLTPWQQEFLGTKINQESFERFSDPNYITKTLASSWFTRKGEGTTNNNIDVIAQELSEILGIDVSEQEIVDFIVNYPTNSVRKTTDRMREIQSEYRDITGRAIKNHNTLSDALGLEAPITEYAEDTPFGKIEEEVPFRAEPEGVNVSDKAREDLATKTRIEPTLNELQDKFGIPIEIIHSSEMPEHVKRAAKGKEITATGFYDPSTGVAYILSDKVKRIADLKKTFMHEAVLHKGLDVLFNTGPVNILGKSFETKNDLLEEVFNRMDTETIADRAKYYGKAFFDQYFDVKDGKYILKEGADLNALPAKTKLELAEEALATLNEIESPRLQVMLDKLYNYIKKLMGFTSKQFTKADLRNLLREHRDLVIKQKEELDVKPEVIEEDKVRFRTEEEMSVLKDNNKSTWPKIPTDNVFTNKKGKIPFKESMVYDELIESEQGTIQNVLIDDIIPTQNNLNAYNIEEVKDIDLKPELSLYNGKYYVVDGHHRIANAIIDGENNINAIVYSPDIRFRVAESPEEIKDFIKDSAIKETVYHGTNQNIKEFKLDQIGQDVKGLTSKSGFWFTNSIDEAQQYADYSAERMVPDSIEHEKKVNELLERISQAERKRDYDLVDKLTAEVEDLEFGAMQAEPSGQNIVNTFINIKNPLVVDASKKGFDQVEVINEAKKNNNDGVIFKNISDSPKGDLTTDQYLVFNPEQVLIKGEAPKFRVAESSQELEDFVKDSKVKETVYHGTDQEFEEFDPTKIGTATDKGMLGKGFYFSKNKKTAESYGDIIKTARLNIKNPLLIDTFKSKKELAEHLGIDESTLTVGGTGIKSLQPYTGVFSDAVKSKGYDGVVTKFEIVAFSPDQILIEPKEEDVRFRTMHEKDRKIYQDITDKITSKLEKAGHRIYKISRSTTDFGNSWYIKLDDNLYNPLQVRISNHGVGDRRFINDRTISYINNRISDENLNDEIDYIINELNVYQKNTKKEQEDAKRRKKEHDKYWNTAIKIKNNLIEENKIIGNLPRTSMTIEEVTEKHPEWTNVMQKEEKRGSLGKAFSYYYIRPEEKGERAKNVSRTPSADYVNYLLDKQEDDVKFKAIKENIEKCQVCDKMRTTPEGEAFWQEMMKTKVPISEEEFLENSDVSDILDEDETWEEYLETQIAQDEVDFYKSANGAYFFQTAGFEFIWKTKDSDPSFSTNMKDEEIIRFKVEEERDKVETNPSEAQKEAGNYSMGHVKLDGFDISIENPRGSIRSGVSPEGKRWSNIMPADYGYFKGTVGNDKDHIDVFMGDNLDSDKVFVVDQVDPETYEFDEHKVMMGYNSISKARNAYNEAYDEGWEGLGAISRTTKDGLKEWFKGDTKKPFAPDKVKFRATSEDPAVQKMLDRLQAVQKLSKATERIKGMEAEKKMTPSKLSRKFAQDKIDLLKEGIQLGREEAKETITEVQKAITDYAKKTLPLTEAGAREIGPVLTLVKNAQTPNAIIKAFERIDELAGVTTERTERRKNVAKVNRLLKWMTGLKKSGQKRVGKFAYEDTKAFQNLKDIDKNTTQFIKTINSRKATADEKAEATTQLDKLWNELNEKADKNDLDNAAMKLIELRRLGSKASPKLAQIVSEELEAIYTKAKEAKNEIDMLKGMQRKADKNLVRSFLEDSKALKKQPWYKRAMTQINTGVADVMGNWETLMIMIGGTELRDKMSFMLDEANMTVGKQETTDNILNSAKDIYGVKSKNGTLNKIHELSAKDYELRRPNRKGEAGAGEPMSLSKLHLMDIYNALKNEDVENDYYMAYGDISLNDDGSRNTELQKADGKATITKLLENLSDEDKAFADAMQAELDKYYDRLNEVHIKLYNRDLPRVENYWPSTAEREQDIDVMEQFFIDSRHPSATKERSAHRTPLPQDAFNKFTKHIDEAEWYVNMALPVMEANKLFKDNNIKTLIGDVRGEKFYKHVEESLQNVTLTPPGKAQQKSKLTAMLNPLLNNWVASKIGATPSVPLKQLLSAVNYAENMPMEQWVTGFIKDLASPKDTWDEMMKIPYLKARLGDGYSEAVQRALNGDEHVHKSKVTNYHTAFKNLMTIGTRYGDIAAIIFGGKPYLDYLLKTGLNEKDAVDKFLQDTLRSQQAPFASTLSKLQNSRNPFFRAVFAFSNTPSQYMRKLFEANQNLRVQKKQLNAGKITQEEYNKARKQTIKAHTIYALVNTVSFTMVGALIGAFMKGSGVDDDIWKDMLNQLGQTYTGGLPVIKDLIGGMTRRTLGMPIYDDAKPFVEGLDEVVTEGIKIAKGESKDEAKSYEKIGQGVATMLAIPYYNIKKDIEAIPPFREETFKATREKEVERKLNDIKKGSNIQKANAATSIKKAYSKAKKLSKKLKEEGQVIKSKRIDRAIELSKRNLWKSNFNVSDIDSELKMFDKRIDRVK